MTGLPVRRCAPCCPADGRPVRPHACPNDAPAATEKRTGVSDGVSAGKECRAGSLHGQHVRRPLQRALPVFPPGARDGPVRGAMPAQRGEAAAIRRSVRFCGRPRCPHSPVRPRAAFDGQNCRHSDLPAPRERQSVRFHSADGALFPEQDADLPCRCGDQSPLRCAAGGVWEARPVPVPASGPRRRSCGGRAALFCGISWRAHLCSDGLVVIAR